MVGMASARKRGKTGHPVLITALVLLIIVVVFFTVGYVLARVLI
jgi:hypothetical protein